MISLTRLENSYNLTMQSILIHGINFRKQT
jgi:hypothetical protein